MLNPRNVKFGLKDPNLVQGWDTYNIQKQPKKIGFTMVPMKVLVHPSWLVQGRETQLLTTLAKTKLWAARTLHMKVQREEGDAKHALTNQLHDIGGKMLGTKVFVFWDQPFNYMPKFT